MDFGAESIIRDFQKINYPIYSDNIFLSPPAPCPPTYTAIGYCFSWKSLN